jgi:perosamine synthetase
MDNNFIPVNIPLLDGREKELLIECIETGWISSEGPFVGKFEEQVAQRVSRKYGIAVANGSAALDIAVAALEIQVGDEVIMPTHTIISCAASVVRAGAIPVLIDSDPVTWNIDVNQIEDKITDKTVAIMVVHIFGLPVDMDPIFLLAKKYRLRIIEDAAQMMGQTYKKRPCGSFGDISTFSFYPNKHVTTGEGGMVLTNDEYLANRCRSLRNLCFKPEQRFVHDELGWNYRMTNLQAAVGIAQLETLDAHLDKKRQVGRLYQEKLDAINGVQLPLAHTNYADSIYWVFGVVLNSDVGIDANTMIKRLASKGIGCRPFFWPMHKQPVFNKMGMYKGVELPVSEMLAVNGFYLPSGLALSDDDVERVAFTLHDVVSSFL